MPRVNTTIIEHIACVTLTRPDKKNAMDQQMIDEIIAAGQRVAQSDARVVVLGAEGGVFCAGIDLAGLGAMIGENMDKLILPRTHGDGTTNQWQEVAMIWHRLPQPVIAALEGPVFGAGLQLALGADIRIAAPDAQLAVMEMKWGIVPDMGGMVLLPRLVRSDVLRHLVYSARPVSADKAAEIGLVTEIADDPLSAAMALADQIAGKSPRAIQAAKQLIEVAETAEPAEVLLAEAEAQAGLLGKPEQMEVVAAEFGKRAPVFK